MGQCTHVIPTRRDTQLLQVVLAIVLPSAVFFLPACGSKGGDNTVAGPPATPVLLQGDPNGPAVAATVDMSPVGVEEADIQGGIILTRLDLHLAPGATVGQINAALESVNGGIVTMVRGLPTLTIAIPRPQDLNALDDVVQALRTAPGISWVSVAHVADPKVLPPSPASDLINLTDLDHLLPTRFPAAWNASRLATNGCATRKVPVLVVDNFRSPLVPTHANFPTEIPNFTLIGSPSPPDIVHGYDVTTIMAALFDATNPTGANPFSDCLEIKGIQIFGLDNFQEKSRIAANFPPGKFLLNYSQGFRDTCDRTISPDGCTPALVATMIVLPLDRAYDAVNWKDLTAARWDDFLVFVAAGNERDAGDTAIYPGLGVSVFDAEMSVATLADPFFGFVEDGSFWDPQPGFPDYPSLKADSAAVLRLKEDIQTAALDTVGPADNVLMVGSTTPGLTYDQLAESASSDSGPDLFAVGEGVFTFDGSKNGTSVATPQVTGLASYLWLVSDDLRRNQPSRVTRRAILDNTRSVPGVGGVIDAYAAVLSLDRAVSPAQISAPVRLAILDVNDNTFFDNTDIEAFLRRYFLVDAMGNITTTPVAPTIADFSRHDLNGDGFTGGSGTEQFDLDRVGSTQYGQTQYDASVSQTIEAASVSFNENQLTDLQILCYYAYSPLHIGAASVRTQLLGGPCVAVGPSIATLAGEVTRTTNISSDSYSLSALVTVQRDGNDLSVTGASGTDRVVAVVNNDPEQFNGTACSAQFTTNGSVVLRSARFVSNISVDQDETGFLDTGILVLAVDNRTTTATGTFVRIVFGDDGSVAAVCVPVDPGPFVASDVSYKLFFKVSRSQDGSIIALDFGRTFIFDGDTVVQTGQLQ